MIKLLNFYKYNPQLGSNRSLSEEKYELHDSLNRLYTWMKPRFHLMSSSFLGRIIRNMNGLDAILFFKFIGQYLKIFFFFFGGENRTIFNLKLCIIF